MLIICRAMVEITKFEMFGQYLHSSNSAYVDIMLKQGFSSDHRSSAMSKPVTTSLGDRLRIPAWVCGWCKDNVS